MSFRIIYALCCLAIFASAQSDDEWDPTSRDKTTFCATMAEYSPTGEIYCERFSFCCTSQFDPNNGDKCQVKELSCNPIPGGSTGEGVCRYSNCTELITTTTTTTTPTPSFDSINSGIQVTSIISFIFTTIIYYTVL